MKYLLMLLLVLLVSCGKGYDPAKADLSLLSQDVWGENRAESQLLKDADAFLFHDNIRLGVENSDCFYFEENTAIYYISHSGNDITVTSQTTDEPHRPSEDMTGKTFTWISGNTYKWKEFYRGSIQHVVTFEDLGNEYFRFQLKCY